MVCNVCHFCQKQISHISFKMQDFSFRYPLSTGHGIPCYKERHPLLLERFITSCRCIMMVRWASYSIYTSPRGPQCVISTRNKTHLKYYHAKCKISGTPLSTGNGITRNNERHPLLLGCFIALLTCILMIRGALDSIYKTLMVQNVSFIPKINLNFHAKCKLLGTLAAQEMGCSATRRDIHCCLCAS